jgi:hypothetical protein
VFQNYAVLSKFLIIRGYNQILLGRWSIIKYDLQDSISYWSLDLAWIDGMKNEIN